METDPPTTPIAAPTADPAATPTTSRAALTADLTTARDTPHFEKGMRIAVQFLDAPPRIGTLDSKVTREMGGGKYDWIVVWSSGDKKVETLYGNNKLDYKLYSSSGDDDLVDGGSPICSPDGAGRELRQPKPSTPPQVQPAAQVTGHGSGGGNNGGKGGKGKSPVVKSPVVKVRTLSTSLIHSLVLYSCDGVHSRNTRHQRRRCQLLPRL